MSAAVVLGNPSTEQHRQRLSRTVQSNLRGIRRDAQRRGHLARREFHKKFRVEGVTPNVIGGRPALVFVDDRGGYQVVWGDDPRLL